MGPEIKKVQPGELEYQRALSEGWRVAIPGLRIVIVGETGAGKGARNGDEV